jgi:hypothetical protein
VKVRDNMSSLRSHTDQGEYGSFQPSFIVSDCVSLRAHYLHRRPSFPVAFAIESADDDTPVAIGGYTNLALSAAHIVILTFASSVLVV